MDRANITKEFYEMLCEGLAITSRRNLAGYLAHGADATREGNGVKLTRNDWTAAGYYIFIPQEGSSEKKPLDSQS